MRRDRRQHGWDEQGMTLLEILIVLAVIAMAMFLGYYVVSSVTKSALRDDTVEVASALKSAHNLAAQSGMHHRVVFDLDKQTYRIEVCPDPIQIKRGDQEEVIDKEALDRLKDEPNPLQAANNMGLGAMGGMGSATEEVSDAESPEAALKAAAALKGMRVGASRCGIAPASGGDELNLKDPQQPNIHQLDSRGKGIKLRRVYVQHLREEVSAGEVSINFFPLGQAEKALLEVGDDSGEQYTVLLYGLTGRVEVRDGPVDPDKHMRRNAAGDEEDDK